ncbi:histone deacetylase [Candidatus Aminicenantes bacterium AH-873-B07]|jgi:acetoin utilization deacetylase AcuC-like enzyme|nr:histone deacetylase [Candidatus Aminicenantes bacterium AH-873-B07]
MFKLLKSIFKRNFPRFIYSNKYWVNIGNHVFPVEKYRLIYEQLIKRGIKRKHVITPNFANDEDILLVHTPKYIKKLKKGSLSLREIITLELPYSKELINFAWLFVGGTIETFKWALKEGLAIHIGGGFHHAFPDHGEGFCVLNDIAIGLKKLKKENQIKKAMVIDCDVHQGNGTAFIFSNDPDIFTFSIHQMDNYPAEKQKSDIDIGLWSGDGDWEYLHALGNFIPKIYIEFKPDLIVYLAGADPYERDQLGGLKITKKALFERDKIVIEGALKLKIPSAILLAGGYAIEVKDTVEIHLNTINLAIKLYRKYI